MADMTEYSKKEFPSQTENRRQWILDTVRANQKLVADILEYVQYDDDRFNHIAAETLRSMHKLDRDAILQPGGILTDEQIELLK